MDSDHRNVGAAIEDTSLALSLTNGKPAWTLPDSSAGVEWVAAAGRGTWAAYNPFAGQLAVLSAASRPVATTRLTPHSGLVVSPHLAVGDGHDPTAKAGGLPITPLARAWRTGA